MYVVLFCPDFRQPLIDCQANEHKLTDEERERNSFGTSLSFPFRPGPPAVYPYDLPTLDGLHLVQGLCDGVLLGAESLAGFPSLKTIHLHAMLGYHGVNIHGTKSQNKSMVIHVKGPHEDKKTQEVAEEMIGQRVFIGWPFLQEGKVTAVSDSLFKYEKMEIIPVPPKRLYRTPILLRELVYGSRNRKRPEHTTRNDAESLQGILMF